MSQAAGANCGATINFTPAPKRQRTATLSIADSAVGPQTVALSETGK
jgi:hypothetical protein